MCFFWTGLVVLALACSSVGSTAREADPMAAVSGTWVLRTINGKPLPYRVGNQFDILSSNLVLSGSKYQNTRLSNFFDHYRIVSDNRDEYDNPNVRWMIQGSTLTVNVLLPSAVRTSTGTINGNVLTLVQTNPFRFPAGTYVYTR